MDRILTQLRQRRAPLRRWLALCVLVFGLQAATPALAWCLHGDDVTVHAGVTAEQPMAADHCAHHHDDHHDDHRMFDARDPGTLSAQAAGSQAPACPGIVLRLPVSDAIDTGRIDTAAARGSAHPPDIPLIEHLAGTTTRLLI